MSRRALLVLLVAFLLTGSGTALAAWVSAGTGTATGHAGKMGTPTVTLGTATCATSGLTTTVSVPASWGAVDGAAQYVVESSRLSSFALFSSSQTVTTRSATVSTTTLGTRLYVRVRAVAGKWTGPDSATVSVATC